MPLPASGRRPAGARWRGDPHPAADPDRTGATEAGRVSRGRRMTAMMTTGDGGPGGGAATTETLVNAA